MSKTTVDSKDVKQKISKNFIVINKIKLYILYFLSSVVTSLFFELFDSVWCVLTVLWTFMFIIIYFYIPKYYNSFFYVISDNTITINYGVVFSKQSILKKHQITKTIVYQGIFQKLLRTKSVLISSPGTQIYLPCLDSQAVDNILNNI